MALGLQRGERLLSSGGAGDNDSQLKLACLRLRQREAIAPIRIVGEGKRGRNELVVQFATQSLGAVAANGIDHFGKTIGKSHKDGRCRNLLSVLSAQRNSMNTPVRKTLRDVEIEGTGIAACLPVGIVVDVRPGRSADLRDSFSIHDCFQESSGFAIDPALEMQSTQPAQFAGLAQIDETCAFILQVDGLADRSSEIGKACLQDARGSEQIWFDGHCKPVSAIQTLLEELRDEGIGVGRSYDQTIEQNLNRVTALRSLGIEHEARKRAVLSERKPADQFRLDRPFCAGLGDGRHAQDRVIQFDHGFDKSCLVHVGRNGEVAFAGL